MKLERWWNPRLDTLSGAAVIFVLHVILQFVLVRYDIVSSIFAAGAHVPRWMFACTVLFVGVRLSLLLFVPAALARRLVLHVLGVAAKGRSACTPFIADGDK